MKARPSHFLIIHIFEMSVMFLVGIRRGKKFLLFILNQNRVFY